MVVVVVVCTYAVQDLKDSLEKFGYSSGVVEKLEGVLVGEVKTSISS